MKKIFTTLSIIIVGALSAQSQTIVNPGFENWQMDSSGFGSVVENPTGWFTDNFGMSTPDAVTKSTDAHSGSFSAIIAPTTFFMSPFPGILEYDAAITSKSKYLNGYYKSKVSSADTFIIGVEFMKSSTQESYTGYQICQSSKTAWTPFNIQIDMPTGFTPDSLFLSMVIMGSSTTNGMLDDLSFSNTAIGSPFGKVITNSVRRQTAIAMNASLFPNPARDFADLSFYLSKPAKVQIVITDVTGKEMRRINNNTTVFGQQKMRINTEDLQSGIYFYSIVTPNGVQTKRFMVSK